MKYLMDSRSKLLIDLLLWAVSSFAAFAFRSPSTVFSSDLQHVWLYLVINLCVFSGIALHKRLYGRSWIRFSIRDLIDLASIVAAVTVVMLILSFAFQNFLHFSRGVPILTGMIGFILLGAVRLAARLASEKVRREAVPGKMQQRVLIVGAGEAGTLIAREMQRHPEAGLEPVGFLDDNMARNRQLIMGLPIFGPVQNLVQIARQLNAQEVLIAIPSANGDFVRQVIDLAREAQLRYRIIPGVFEILSGDVNINQIRDVNLEDLLRRAPVHLNTTEIAGYLRERVVLVTGAGGSIGSEIVRQIARFKPSTIILFGRGENSIFSIQQEMLQNWPEIKQIGLIGDVRDEVRMRSVFSEYRPDVVFHAAAHKHVPLMEQSPSEAILNNIMGTRNVVQLCLEYSVTRLVNISTDKAVNPTSVMGASKRVAEMVVSAGAARSKETQAFVSVRFGNVLGSRGSVVPTFMNQIRSGGPITVTHPEMVRYFMTIPEAARLVLQAGGLAENGKVYVLNMGDPVKISDLAHDVIRLSGAKNIDVVYNGVRPGEKLYEELLTSGEGVNATTHTEIFSAKLANVNPEDLENQLMSLKKYAADQNSEALREALKIIIPENKFGSLR